MHSQGSSLDSQFPRWEEEIEDECMSSPAVWESSQEAHSSPLLWETLGVQEGWATWRELGTKSKGLITAAGTWIMAANQHPNQWHHVEETGQHHGTTGDMIHRKAWIPGRIFHKAPVLAGASPWLGTTKRSGLSSGAHLSLPQTRKQWQDSNMVPGQHLISSAH